MPERSEWLLAEGYLPRHSTFQVGYLRGIKSHQITATKLPNNRITAKVMPNNRGNAAH